MALCPKCKSAISRNETSTQCRSCKDVHRMKYDNLNTESLDFMRFKGISFNCEQCTKQLKQVLRSKQILSQRIIMMQKLPNLISKQLLGDKKNNRKPSIH